MSQAAQGIDPRGPRVGAAITSILLIAVIILDPQAGLVVLAVVVASFALGAAAGVGRTWQGLLYRRLIRPRLRPPAELEHPAPPRFAQAVGLVITGLGLTLGLLGVAWAPPVFAGVALVAAFLNAAFGFCLGCEMYLLVRRARTPRAA
ncbi:DUF4395 domain-containing protein [Ruania suaedae]|uniref:DUF4395 domain-containing protein n=1 Tax=Ruania suaedae TaxID=2897774 RepID=UPI001E477C09|nr:DUF4395 domain-containing protein [Ruania suaedae]UFU04500.1 DUF4395 domain-containing protein [Ruania suaedae]